MIESKNPDKEYTIDEMIHHMHNPKNKLRSLAELDDVIEEIIERNPEWLAELETVIKKG
jgi:hypothetical protein